MTPPARLYLVVPCYNEETILEDTLHQLETKLDELAAGGLIAPDSAILLVDDGSGDRTWELIEAAHRREPRRIAGVRLAANRGHQAALLAGLIEAGKAADAVISLDADLQDDIDILPDFLKEFYAGSDIVYGVRSDRSSDSFFKRFTAESFYRLMKHLGVKTVYNHADYRLMSARAIAALAEYPEVNLYLRGLIPLIGFRQSLVFYRRKKANRPTHYPLSKMLLLAWDGITSFSVRPIRLIALFGLLTLAVSFVLLLYILYSRFFGHTTAGWTSLGAIIVFLGGVQIFSIGVIGEYIAKSYLEAKHRPRFLIRQQLPADDDARRPPEAP